MTGFFLPPRSEGQRTGQAGTAPDGVIGRQGSPLPCPGADGMSRVGGRRGRENGAGGRTARGASREMHCTDRATRTKAGAACRECEASCWRQEGNPRPPAGGVRPLVGSDNKDRPAGGRHVPQATGRQTEKPGAPTDGSAEAPGMLRAIVRALIHRPDGRPAFADGGALFPARRAALDVPHGTFSAFPPFCGEGRSVAGVRRRRGALPPPGGQPWMFHVEHPLFSSPLRGGPVSGRRRARGGRSPPGRRGRWGCVPCTPRSPPPRCGWRGRAPPRPPSGAPPG